MSLMADIDVIVCGLGITGSAVLHQLARRGVHAVGIERFTPGHDRGSSHGESRIIRLGYFEHPSYVPLVRRAHAMWRALEAEAGQPLLHVTGIVEIGPPEGLLVQGTLASSRRHDLPHEILAAGEVMRRYPAFRLPPHHVGVVQPDGGVLAVEAAVRAFLTLAQRSGAQLRTGETIRAIEPRGSGVRVITDHGTLDAGTAIVATGPWIASLLPELALPLRVTRQVTAWFAPSEPAQFAPDRFPVFLLESEYGIHYGFPRSGTGGVKVAKHHHRDQCVDPETCDRTVSIDDEALIRAAVATYLPAANGPLTAAKTCLYTVAPDGDFIIDRAPQHPQLVVASACSGHGFKFAPVIGEILADLATAGTTRHDISRFSLTRFASSSS
jgi:sarcosine oxidase